MTTPPVREVTDLGMPSRLSRLLAGQMEIANRQDASHCAACGRDIGRWYYGFPYPLCCRCVDVKRRPVRLRCPITRYEASHA